VIRVSVCVTSDEPGRLAELPERWMKDQVEAGAAGMAKMEEVE